MLAPYMRSHPRDRTKLKPPPYREWAGGTALPAPPIRNTLPHGFRFHAANKRREETGPVPPCNGNRSCSCAASTSHEANRPLNPPAPPRLPAGAPRPPALEPPLASAT
ncbi:hypothetical protein Vretifemale_17227 [Volvox reticuliferus]|uniref:Uncharacterized protein n=1 Tax=Volvox reticuliferus TaxID=1737510 RepID=A0A8J4CUX1_9CHLO|nr:hypothetical protein Vretifemale_17227 [Volvox reticuliferus]